jgi:hypothetical protein
MIGATPWLPAARRLVAEWNKRRLTHSRLRVPVRSSFAVGRTVALGGLLFAVAVVLSAATYNPFIYFRF